MKTTFSILSNIYFNHIKDIIKQNLYMHDLQANTYTSANFKYNYCFFMCFRYTASKKNKVH